MKSCSEKVRGEKALLPPICLIKDVGKDWALKVMISQKQSHEPPTFDFLGGEVYEASTKAEEVGCFRSMVFMFGQEKVRLSNNGEEKCQEFVESGDERMIEGESHQARDEEGQGGQDGVGRQIPADSQEQIRQVDQSLPITSIFRA